MTRTTKPEITPSIFAYALGGDGNENTPLYLLDGDPVELGSINLRDDWQRFVEHGTGQEVHVRRTDCGLGCRCAAVYTLRGVPENH